MSDLFGNNNISKKSSGTRRPLADRMRPTALHEFVGQKEILAPGKPLRKAIESDCVPSIILWGPPGSGKTSLAAVIAGSTSSVFVKLSAVTSGIKDVKTVIEKAAAELDFSRRRTILFVDEIHRFNKAQQDAFLHHVENGLITLIGATTENPSFEVIPALISRCRVITLAALPHGQMKALLMRALGDRENGLGMLNLKISEAALDHIVSLCDG
ncbi:MAG: AAA family ATPase, partial [Fibrobacterota bacterium]